MWTAWDRCGRPGMSVDILGWMWWLWDGCGGPEMGVEDLR